MKSDWKNEPLVVLDACALIAFFNDESGADVVAEILIQVPRVEIAAVNLLEIAYDAIRRTGLRSAATEIIEAALSLPIHVNWELDQEILENAAAFKAFSRISLADAVALGLASTRQAPLATSDHHEFEPIEAAGSSRFLWIR